MTALHGKVAIVTGGASDVGPRICRALTEGGARIAIVDVDATSARALAVSLDADGTQVIAVSCDAMSPDELARSMTEVVDWFGAVDIVVNNVHDGQAGATRERMSVTGPSLATDLMGACQPHIVSGGHVINVVTDLDAAAIPDSIAQEWDWYGIGISTVAAVAVEADDESPTTAGKHGNDLDRLLAGTALALATGALVA